VYWPISVAFEFASEEVNIDNGYWKKFR